ncbi:hypothetical protein PanWU01x14_185770 [Parasponia andersonii]|uniref:Uncharacterized protein n=1 Tax=Parasponia andersonii TaxID=3476 RepID=A0A2P5C418_PARAD|nr:hypothetical protein PanWU01x14_185770 [Parasponia andersonii]
MAPSLLVVMIAGYDTSFVLLTFMLRFLSNESVIYKDVLQVSDALAAKSGGRIGSQAFRSSALRSAPIINNNSR